MHLTTHTDYAMRALIFVALHEGSRCTISQLAESFAISRNHLMKVVHQLQRLGYLHTTRGRGGGLRLGMPASEIRIGKLVQQMEPDLALAECLGPDNQCIITPHCRLKIILADALQTFLDTLDDYTLKDVCTFHTEGLRRDLHIMTEY